MILDIKERWGLFLVENELEKIEKEYKDESSLIINENMFSEVRNKFNFFMNDLKKRIKGRYIYLNSLLLCKTFNKDKCNEAVIRSPVLCLGSYSFRSLYNLRNNASNCRQDAYHDFKTLENNCNIILNQLRTYNQMMVKLNVKENSDLDDQIRQKIKFVGELLSIIRNNIDVLYDNIANQNGKNIELIPKIITLKDINYLRDYYDDILDYFKDYGICLYEFQTQEKKPEECII